MPSFGLGVFVFEKEEINAIFIIASVFLANIDDTAADTADLRICTNRLDIDFLGVEQAGADNVATKVRLFSLNICGATAAAEAQQICF